MTTYSTPMHGHRRPRLRRSIGAVAAAAVMALPFAVAPAASAQTANNPVGGIENTLGGTITSLPNTAARPLGGSSGDGPPGDDACVDPVLISPLLSCVIDSVARLLGGQSTPARTTKATLSKRVRSMRRQTRTLRVR